MSDSGLDLALDLDACPCGGVNLDKLVQPAILALLAEGPMHGYKLVERIGAGPILHGRNPDSSGVYRALRAMERKNYVVSHWDLSSKGPARKSYQLTEAGRCCLTHWIESLDAYRRRINALLKTARKAIARESRPARRSRGCCGGARP
jgi:PadR family transcriptional regulator, regulatory protein PadR